MTAAEWVDDMLTTTVHVITNPIGVDSAPTPDYWEGYKACLLDLQRVLRQADEVKEG